MQYRRLGSTGLKVSQLCLGMMSYGSSKWRPWVLDEDASLPFIQRALELGINFFDTADMYSNGASEEILGRAVRRFARREDVVIATKVYYPISAAPNDGGLSRKHILDSIDGSLRRLATDHVDVYQIHRWDPHTPIEETLEALNDVVRSGKARYIGASSMFAWQFAKALYLSDRHNWARFVSMQNRYNPLYREEEREMIPLCESEGVGVLPYSPLARGWLAKPRSAAIDTRSVRAQTDQYAPSELEPYDQEVVQAVSKVANKHNCSMAKVAIAWVCDQPGVTAPIIGATRIEQLGEAVAALELVLTPDDRASIEAPYRPRQVLTHD